LHHSFFAFDAAYRVRMIPQLLSAIGAVKKVAEHIFLSVLRLRGAVLSGMNHLLHSLKGRSVNYRLMHVFENHPILRRIFKTCFLFKGTGVGFKVDYISAIFLPRKNLLNCRALPLIRIRLRLFPTTAQSRSHSRGGSCGCTTCRSSRP